MKISCEFYGRTLKGELLAAKYKRLLNEDSSWNANNENEAKIKSKIAAATKVTKSDLHRKICSYLFIYPIMRVIILIYIINC